jgi:FkbM family methyltransferase
LELNGQHEWSEIETIASYLTRDDDLLIVGAHIGLTVIPLAPRCRSVTAVEASPRNFELLKWNLAINGIHNVNALNIAASDKRERLQFVMSRGNTGGSKRMPVVHDDRYFFDSPQIASLDAAPLDEILPTLSPIVILMDIEGSEYFAIRGMHRLLSCAKVLAMEFLPHHLRNVTGVTVEELLRHLPRFAQLIVPSKNLTVEPSRFYDVLQEMYERDEGDEGIIFLKET